MSILLNNLEDKLKKIILLLFILTAGCNFSPFSPSNKPNIRNNGDIGDIKNNQQGIMAEIMTLKNRMDIISEEIENIQNGFINQNNKNNGVQILQGDGGLIFAISSIGILAIVSMSYRIKAQKYKKTAELFGDQIKKMNNLKIEENIMLGALANKIEKETFSILKNQSKS